MQQNNSQRINTVTRRTVLKTSEVSRFTFEIDYAVWFGNSMVLATLGVIAGAELSPKLGAAYVILAIAMHLWAIFWFFYLTNSIGSSPKKGEYDKERKNESNTLHIFPGFLFTIVCSILAMYIWTVYELLHIQRS
jgi:hypothetical protein